MSIYFRCFIIIFWLWVSYHIIEKIFDMLEKIEKIQQKLNDWFGIWFWNDTKHELSLWDKEWFDHI